uniref:Histone deacetylase 14 n=1 Tax=Tanacetum cinerariifolium TaxID=118510 RepID=A0A699HXX1_TANCI|nr:histone deacetylase 14 [Tanacetum cinerariifolium]
MADVNVNAPADQAPTMAPPIHEQWFDLTKDTLKDALQTTPINNNQAFTSLPSSDALINFVNELGYPKLIRNLSNVVTNDMFQPWRALTTIINLCLTRKTSGFERPRALVQKESGTAYSREKEGYSYCDPEYPVYQVDHLSPSKEAQVLPNEEPVLGYLRFSANGTKREVFKMPIPGNLITADIQGASYYQENLEKVAKHQRYMAGETGSDPDSPTPKPTKTAKKSKLTAPKADPRPPVLKPASSKQIEPKLARAKTQGKKRKLVTEISDKTSQARKSKPGLVSKRRKPMSSLRSVDESMAEDIPEKEPRIDDEEADVQRALEGSLKSMYNIPWGPLPPVVIREPKSRKYQPLLETPIKKSPADRYIFQRCTSAPTRSSGHDESSSLYAELRLTDNEEELDEDVPGTDAGVQGEDQAGQNPDAQDEGQTRSNPDEQAEGQAGPNPGNAEASQPLPSLIVHAGLDLKHVDLDVADVSTQPHPEQMDEGFTATAYPKVQENLNLMVEEQVILEEPASSSGTLASLQHHTKDLIFGDLFFSDKPSEANNDKATAETKAKSMVYVTIQQDTSSIPLMTTSIIDLTSRPESPKVHQLLKATAIETTTTITTTIIHPPPSQQHQSTTDSMMMMRIGELEHIMANLIQDNKQLEKRLDNHGAHLYTLEHLDILHRVSKAVDERFWILTSATTTPPPPSTNQEGQSKGSTAPSSSKTAASAEYQAWTTTDTRLGPSISLTPADLQMNEDMALDVQAQSSDDEDIKNAHIPKVNLRQDWWKPLEEERHATLEPAWSILLSDVPVPKNNWASALESTYSHPPKDSLIAQTGDIAIMPQAPDNSVDDSILRHTSEGGRRAVRTHIRILSVVRIEVFSIYGYDYMKKIVLRRADLNEHAIAEQDFKHLVIRQRVEYFQLGIKSYQTQLNLTKPQWDATSFEYKHDYTVIDSSRAVTFRDRYGVQMIMRFNDIHKFSDGTLQQIDEALDYWVKEFKINRMNPGLNIRFWTRKDVDRSKEFMFTIQKRLKTRRIFINLESFVGGRVRDIDYRLLKRTG